MVPQTTLVELTSVSEWLNTEAKEKQRSPVAAYVRGIQCSKNIYVHIFPEHLNANIHAQMFFTYEHSLLGELDSSGS